MKPETLAAIKAILLTDPTLSDADRQAIIAACRNPSPKPDRKPPAKLLKVRQVAEIIGVHPKTVQRMVRRGRLPRVALSSRAMRYRRWRTWRRCWRGGRERARNDHRASRSNPTCTTSASAGSL